MNAVIFLGPTLANNIARGMLPNAVFLPPARQADMISALRAYKPRTIGLVDGAFGEALSVWHKEILYALEQGVHVLGAASMGALRAAELSAFGMQGVGAIYELYRTGELTDDDEVAVVHASAEDNFRPLSEPMVNLRATFERACASGLLDAGSTHNLLAAAKRLHFSERSMPNIIAQAELPRATAEQVMAAFKVCYTDVKAADAAQLLATINGLDDRPIPAAPVVRSRAFEHCYHNDRKVGHAGTDVPLHAIVTHAALQHPEFDTLNFAALNRALVQELARILELEPTAAELTAEAERFRRQRGLDLADVSRWLVDNDLTLEEYAALMRELAVCRRLQRWLIGSNRGTQQSRWLLDELRLRGLYTDLATATACDYAVLDTWANDVDGLAELDEAALMELLPAQQQATGWAPHAPLDTWAEEAGYTDLQALAYELLRAQRVRELRRRAARSAETFEMSTRFAEGDR